MKFKIIVSYKTTSVLRNSPNKGDTKVPKEPRGCDDLVARTCVGGPIHVEDPSNPINYGEVSY